MSVRFRLLIAYEGTRYYGWQKQKNLPTIQGIIEQTLHQILQRPVVLFGAGRTDAGVHALGQVAHFDLETPSLPCSSLQKSLNALLPHDICIKCVWIAPKNFHALRSSISKHYTYLVLYRNFPNVFWQKKMYWYPHKVDIPRLQEMSCLIRGKHDFRSFQNKGTPLKSTVRTLYSARWTVQSRHVLGFHVRGDGFLKQMIRNLVGTQLALLKQKDATKKLHNILQAKNRKKALASAPPWGLYLNSVSYTVEHDRKCKKIT